MANSYTSASLVEAELRATTVFSSSTVPSLASVTTWIDEESAQIDRDIGYSIAATQRTDIVDYDGSIDPVIYLQVAPVVTADTISYNTARLGSDDYSTSWVVKTEDTDFTVYTDKGTIEFLPGFSPSDGKKKFKLVYTAGYSTTPLVIQRLASKRTALRILNTLIQNNVSDRNDGGSISVGSINIVEPSNYGVGSYTQLKDDIDAITNDVTKDFGMRRYGNY